MKKKSLLLILLMALMVPWAAAQTTVLSEDFDAMSTISASYSATNWYAYKAGSGNNWSLNTSSSYAHSGSNSAQYNYNSSNDANCYLVSAPFDVNAKMDELGVSVYERVRLASYAETFEVFFVKASDITDVASVATATHYSAIASASYTNESFAEVTGSNSNSALAGQSVRLVVHCTSEANMWALFIDDITVTETLAESCPKPKNLEATNITDESATLTWTSSETPSNGFNVRYRTAEAPNASFFDDFESNSLTGWTVYTDGAAPQSDGWYTFEPSTSGLAFEAHSGSYCASAWSWSNSAYNANNWLISPQVTFSKTVKFWVRTNAVYPDSYEVLLSTTGTDEADFTETLQAMAPAPTTGAWEQVSIDLTAYSGTGYIAIHHVDNDNNYLLIDDFGIYDDPIPAGAWTNTTSNTNSKDIAGLTESTLYDFEVQSNCGGETSSWVASTFTTLASCMPVANLAVSDVTTTTVSLTWTDQNSGSASYIITDGDNHAVTVTNLTATGCTVIELTANTLYTFKVSADCGSTVETIQASTDCNALSTIPYNEGFEASSEIIYCWDLDGFSRLNNPTYAHTGNVSLYGSQDLAYAILPITTANTSALMLNFWWTNGYSGYDMGSLEVGYITDIDDYSTFVPVGTIDMSNSSDEYTHTDDFVFTGAPDGSRIAFKYNEGYSAQVLIDDVTVEYKPACMRPTNLVALNPTGHGATFAWDGNGSAAEDGWQLYISKNGSAISTGYESPSGVIDADTNPFTVTSGLDPETDYYVWVRSHCDTQGYSPWSNSATFTTTEACPAPTGLAASEVTNHTAKLSWTGTSESYVLSVGTYDYTATPVTGTILEEGFESWSVSATPTGWTHLGAGTIGVQNPSATHIHGGSKAFRFSGTTSDNIAVLPNYGVETNQLTIDFWMKAEGSSSGTFEYGYVTDASNATTFTKLGEYSASTSTSYQHVENLSMASAPNGARIAFKHKSGSSSWYWFIDDLTITGPIYPIAYTEYNTSDMYKTVEGLLAETPYFAKVKGNCGSDGYSQETAVISFTTDIACPAPTGLTASNPKSNSFDLQWTNGGSEDWVLAYKVDGAADFTELDLNVSDVTEEAGTISYTLGGLDAETDYIVKVRDNCEASYAGDGVSEWTAEVPYSTIAACSALNPVVSNVTHHNATVNFEGESATGFTVNYRVASGDNALFEEGFENGLGSWTFTSMNAVNGIGGSGSNPAGIQSVAAHSDSYGFRLSSYSTKTSGETYDQYLVSPELTVTGTLKFYAKKYSNTSADNLYVGYSTTTSDLDAFTWDVEALDLTESWNEFTHALPTDVKYFAFHYFGNCAYYVYVDDIAITVPTSPGAWQTQAATGTTANLSGLTAGTKYDVKVVPNCDETLESAIVQFTTLVGNMKYFLTAGEWGTAANWMDEEIPAITDNATIRANVTIAKNYVAYAKNITRENSATITIKDGGELYHSNAVSSATMEKEIAGATTWGQGSGASDGWYVISNPLSYTSLTPTTTSYVTNLAPAAVASVPQFDLYKYSESNMNWYSYNYHPSSYYLTRGIGFLYSRNEDAIISFMSGTYYSLPVADVTPSLTYTAANGDMAGWNLLGNPFSHSITWDNIEATNVNTTGYYKLGNDGAWTADPSTTTPIKPMEGFLVKATAASPTLTIKNAAPSSKGRANDDFLAFTVANSNYSDITYAMFSDGEGLEKINHRNTNVPMVYIPQDGERYAIATMGDGTDMFNLNFKAMTTGKYTLSYKAEGSYDYLHVIDRITGEDVDMLIDGEYSFMASAGDNENRFIVKLRYNANGNFENDIFAYQNGDEIIVNGEGELQIFDVMGRFVTSMEVNGSERISAEQYSNAVYIFRLVGNDVKTQKIVVR